MRKVIFDGISIRNFLSVGEEPVRMNYNPGLNVITGSNLDKEDSGNGIGKSTVAEAIYFALFGETLRELKADQIKHYGAEGKCEVIVKFIIVDNDKTKSYKIIRNSKPSKARIEEDGVDITPSTISQTNEFIKRLIHSSPEVFRNSIIMTANNAVPFMSQRKADKRKFLEGILGLGVFGEMLTVVKQELSEAKQTYTVDYTKYQSQQNNVANLKKQLDTFRKQSKSRKSDLENRITEQKNRLAEIDTKINDLETQLSETSSIDKSKITETLKKLKSKQRTIDKKIMSEELALRTLNDKIEKYASMSDICNECGQHLTQGQIMERHKKIETLSKEIPELESIIKTYNENLSKVNDAISTVEVKKSTADSANELVKTLLTSIDSQKSFKKQTLKSIENLESDINHLNDDSVYAKPLAEAEEEFKVLSDLVNDHNDKLDILNVVKFIVSEDGVRSFVVKKMLHLMNTMINHYLHKLDANCTCTFNEFFEETLIDEKGRECSYFNFSSGERKRIDLAILFTFQDLRRLQSNVMLNISMYDELLDSSLDQQGTQKAIDILQDRVNQYNECVYVVTHKAATADIATGEIIYLEKEDGVTRIVNH